MSPNELNFTKEGTLGFYGSDMDISVEDETDPNASQVKNVPTSTPLPSINDLISGVTGMVSSYLINGVSDHMTNVSSTAAAVTSRRVMCGIVNNIDVSRVPFPRQVAEVAQWEVTVKCLMVAVLVLTAIAGNSLIIVIVSMSKKMKTTTNYYILNMAVADLVVACCPMWIYVTTDVTPGWILGGFLCKFNAFVQTSAMTAISLTMMAVAGDRFFAIVYPLKAKVTKRKVKLVVFFVWVCSLAIAVPPLIAYTYYERRWSNYLETFCHDIWPTREFADGTCDQGVIAERVYWAVVISVLFWIPMVMMTINYTVIIHRLHSSRVVSSNSGGPGMSVVQRRSSKKVVKMLFTLLITFMICAVPFQVVTLYENYKDRKAKLPSWFQPVYFTAVTLMYAHSGINPIMYGAMNQTFQAGFRQLLVRFRRQKFKSSPAVSKCSDVRKKPQIHVVSVVSVDKFDKIDLSYTASICQLIETKSASCSLYGGLSDDLINM